MIVGASRSAFSPQSWAKERKEAFLKAMLLSYSHKFLFIHIPKTAGTSITKALEPYSYNPDRLLRWPILRRVRKRHIVAHRELFERSGGHGTALEARRLIGQSPFRRLFKFAVVRNHWDWHVSLYHFVLQDPNHVHYPLIKSLGSFTEYVKWAAQSRWYVQKDFVADGSGRLLVDFIGRFESLQQDFEYICRRLGLKVSLPHLNGSPHVDYRTYYTAETEALIGDAYRDGIRFFGYTFDGAAPNALHGPFL